MFILKLFFLLSVALLAASPEGLYNKAAQDWENKNQVAAVENLLKSVQLRTNPFRIWSDLSLLSQIQEALLAQPSPIQSIRIKLALLFTENVKTLWFFLAFWLLLISIWFRFGRLSKQGLSNYLAALSLLGFMTGGAALINQRTAKLPSILTGNESMVALYKKPESNNDDKLIELPIGLLVSAEQDQEDWTFLSEPIAGWVKKERLQPFPKP